MILWGKRAKAVLEDLERQGRELAELRQDVDRLAKEAVRMMTEAKQPDVATVVSVPSQEGEVWLKARS